MTTIVYNHKDKEIAVDSRLTRRDTIITDNANKIIKNDNGVFILSGYYADCELFASSFPNEPPREVKCYGFVVSDNEVYWLSFEDGNTMLTKCNYNESVGSGQDHALTALDLGLSAKDAVKMAMKRDVNTGGKVRIYKVNND